MYRQNAFEDERHRAMPKQLDRCNVSYKARDVHDSSWTDRISGSETSPHQCKPQGLESTKSGR